MPCMKWADNTGGICNRPTIAASESSFLMTKTYKKENMKKIMLFAAALFLAATVMAQGNKDKKGKSKENASTTQTDQPGNSGEQGKEKDKDKDKDKGKDKDKDKGAAENALKKAKDDMELAKNEEHDKRVFDGIGDNSCMKPSKNQPAKVRAAFQRDYPNAVNVRWTKCRGDWTATFSGALFRSTAVYHANGDRRDTRTPVTREQTPRTIWDIILKRDPRTQVDDGAIKIEVPNAVKEIYRIKSILDGKAQFEYYNADGVKVDYNY